MAGGILLLLAGGAYYLFRPEAPVEVPPSSASISTNPASSGDPAAPGEPPPKHYPPPATPVPPAPLPPLADSDAPFAAVLGEWIDPAALAEGFVSEQLIRRIVVTVDNLPRERVGMSQRAFKRVPGTLAVKNRDGALSLSPANDARYLPLLQLLRTAGVENLAQVYLRHYPLFQEAYRELGYPDAHFNDRLVQVIDHLLATPEIPGPIALVQPKVLYEFADPALESRSAGQKMLIRMGAGNQALSKALLGSFRTAVTGEAAP